MGQFNESVYKLELKETCRVEDFNPSIHSDPTYQFDGPKYGSTSLSQLVHFLKN